MSYITSTPVQHASLDGLGGKKDIINFWIQGKADPNWSSAQRALTRMYGKVSSALSDLQKKIDAATKAIKAEAAALQATADEIERYGNVDPKISDALIVEAEELAKYDGTIKTISAFAGIAKTGIEAAKAGKLPFYLKDEGQGMDIAVPIIVGDAEQPTPALLRTSIAVSAKQAAAVLDVITQYAKMRKELLDAAREGRKAPAKVAPTAPAAAKEPAEKPEILISKATPAGKMVPLLLGAGLLAFLFLRKRD